MNKTAPIFLLLKDEVDGPHELEAVNAMLENKVIAEETLACIEDMKGWRSIPETLVWSQACLLEAIQPEAVRMVDQISEHQLEVHSARLELRKALLAKNILDADVDVLATVVDANGSLKRKVHEYSQQEQEWHPGVLDVFPALELYALGKQQFARDWAADWQRAGGNLYDGRMIARKDDPLWFAISDFEFPVPPFSLDVNWWTRNISYKEAAMLGIVTIKDVIQPKPLPRTFAPFFKPLKPSSS